MEQLTEQIEKAKRVNEINPLNYYRQTHFIFDKSELISLLETAMRDAIIQDREKIFREIAMQSRDVGMEDESGNIDHERSCLIGFNNEGIPNSVGLDIYGRTHSDMSFTDPDFAQIKETLNK